MKHTPGPWKDDGQDKNSIIISSQWGTVARVVDCGDVVQTGDNARLIAAAPDLLAACRAIVAVLTQPVQFSPQANADILRGDAATAVRFAQAAIARAERGGE